MFDAISNFVRKLEDTYRASQNNTLPRSPLAMAMMASKIGKASDIQGRNVLSDLPSYDIMGYLSENDPVSGHMTDKYKKPGHVSFSNESQYSTKRTPGGHWSESGAVFTPSEWMVDNGPTSFEEIVDYYKWLNNQPGETGVEIRHPRAPKTQKEH